MHTAHRLLVALLAVTAAPTLASAQQPEVIEVEGQPLAANAERLIKALTFLGADLPADVAKDLQAAITDRNAGKIQQILDPRVLFVVSLNPEARVKVARGPAKAVLQQAGYVPALVKVVNDSSVTSKLEITSLQAGPVYGAKENKGRFLQAEVFAGPPMAKSLSGLKVEYVLALLYSSEPGKREATIGFDIGGGNQDLGFRGEVAVLFEVKPAVPVKLTIQDFDGKPTTGRFTFRDATGHVFPPQPKRLAPDFFFQQQIYRPDNGTVLLPPGELTMQFSRGPEYKLVEQKLKVAGTGTDGTGPMGLAVKLERWVNPMDHGFYSGDHHIHAAGCAHYTSPTEGVMAEDMFLHVKGEGLNVGCNLTWGPCFEFQRQFFEPTAHKLSEPLCVLKYDLEISGFGSQALGHVCLLNLRDQTYPGSDGTKSRGWPTWTTPLMKWAKLQGAVTGYAHSASGLEVVPPEAAGRLVKALDLDNDGRLSEGEAAKGLLPDAFGAIDANQDGSLTAMELQKNLARVRNNLPNLAIPEMKGIGAQEICVTTAQGLCDFISAMNTNRVAEWNCWYHIMNCGFPLKVSGETDFPCVSGSRVGQGRVYVQLGKVERVDFAEWCEGLRKGRSYVSDGYAHALDFKVNGTAPGFGEVKLDAAGAVEVKAKVAFASATPLGGATGAATPTGKMRTVELVVNGVAVAKKDVAADDKEHDLTFSVNIDRSSWVALRQYPQLHTNPVTVLVGGKPIRASRKSAEWCVGVIEQLWRERGSVIAAAERGEAEKTFRMCVEIYRKIAEESPEGS